MERRSNPIGVVLNNLGPNQLAYFAIKSVNRANLNVSLFYENMALPCLDVNAPIMTINEIWPFKGTLIATSIDTAIRINKVVGEISRIFYVYDLEWIRNKTNFIYNMEAFHSNIEIIARSNEHAKLIENYSNRKVSRVVSYFEIDKMI